MGSRPKSHYILFQVLKQNMYAPHISQIAISLLLRSRLQKAREQLLLHVAQLQQQQQSQSESLVLSRFEEESSRAERTPQFETTSRPRQIRAQGEEKTILAQKIRRKAKKAQVASHLLQSVRIVFCLWFAKNYTFCLHSRCFPLIS